MGNDQEKVRLLTMIAAFKSLNDNPTMKNYLAQACSAISDNEISYVEHRIKEIQEKCPHNGNNILESNFSIVELRFKQKCCLCGHVIKDGITMKELVEL